MYATKTEIKKTMKWSVSSSYDFDLIEFFVLMEMINLSINQRYSEVFFSKRMSIVKQ